MAGPIFRDNWRIVNASNVFIGMHVVVFIICLIIAFAVTRMGPVLLMVVIALIIILLPQVGIFYFKFYARSKIMREAGVGKEEATKILTGKYHQLDTEGWPDLQELSYYLKTRGFNAVVVKATEMFIPKHKLFINLHQIVSQDNTRHHHRERTNVYYFIQLGPLSPETGIVEEQLKKELTSFLSQKGLLS